MDPDPVVERNKLTFRRLQEQVIANGQFELIPEIFRPDFQVRRVGTLRLYRAIGHTDYPQGQNAHERFVEGLTEHQKLLPDQERVIEEIFGEGNRVAARFRIKATHTHEFAGHPPTGKRLEWTEIAFVRFDSDGLMEEGYFLCDELELAEQLGLTLS